MSSPDLLLRDVEVDGARVDVAIAHGRIDAIGRSLVPAPSAEVIDGNGGALIPGLHDHHVHLFAAAAARESLAVGPADVIDEHGLSRTLREADAAIAPGGWLRAVGYHESVAGDLDRDRLDGIVATRPVRVQHRSGARWTFNTAAIDALDLARRDHPGIERDATGRPTGPLHRADDWLRGLLPPDEVPDLAPLIADLAARGVTGVTDTTPSTDLRDLDALAHGLARAGHPLRVLVTGSPALADCTAPAGLEQGPVKLVIDDGAYPSLDEVAEQLAHAHRSDRPAAVHCVTLPALVLALAAWDVAGAHPRDRIEHGAVIPPALFDAIARHGLTVVTQPGFVAERGDAYLREVEPDDLQDLYRCRTLLDAGIRVAASTDAPYTAADPWAAMRAAVCRRTRRGQPVGAEEAVAPAVALRLFLGDPHDPGGQLRTVTVGARADLCLLARPWSAVLDRLTADDVVATVCSGRVVHDARGTR